MPIAKKSENFISHKTATIIFSQPESACINLMQIVWCRMPAATAKDIPQNISTQDLQVSRAGSRYALAGAPEPASFILWGAHIGERESSIIHYTQQRPGQPGKRPPVCLAAGYCVYRTCSSCGVNTKFSVISKSIHQLDMQKTKALLANLS